MRTPIWYSPEYPLSREDQRECFLDLIRRRPQLGREIFAAADERNFMEFLRLQTISITGTGISPREYTQLVQSQRRDWQSSWDLRWKKWLRTLKLVRARRLPASYAWGRWIQMQRARLQNRFLREQNPAQRRREQAEHLTGLRERIGNLRRRLANYWSMDAPDRRRAGRDNARCVARLREAFRRGRHVEMCFDPHDLTESMRREIWGSSRVPPEPLVASERSGSLSLTSYQSEQTYAGQEAALQEELARLNGMVGSDLERVPPRSAPTKAAPRSQLVKRRPRSEAKKADPADNTIYGTVLKLWRDLQIVPRLEDPSMDEGSSDSMIGLLPVEEPVPEILPLRVELPKPLPARVELPLRRPGFMTPERAEPRDEEPLPARRVAPQRRPGFMTPEDVEPMDEELIRGYAAPLDFQDNVEDGQGWALALETADRAENAELEEEQLWFREATFTEWQEVASVPKSGHRRQPSSAGTGDSQSAQELELGSLARQPGPVQREMRDRDQSSSEKLASQVDEEAPTAEVLYRGKPLKPGKAAAAHRKRQVERRLRLKQEKEERRRVEEARLTPEQRAEAERLKVERPKALKRARQKAFRDRKSKNPRKGRD